MKKKYTFEQVVRLLKRHAGDDEPYVFEFPEIAAHPRQRMTSRVSISGSVHLQIREKQREGWIDDAYPYICDGWELVRPVKVKRDRILIGTVPRASVIGLSGMLDELVLPDIQDGDYDLYAVKP